ncbi:hypothetical protein CLF_109010 [Clonorchis sinensis]|uniref:Uncharacterized protein n=1 Tax=Clonorchis sinensis TaxID=79923 RepID=G7YIU0_CLOSI|nr:hypothetical protein CLF_109010 [Clonorchis sinensis]
MQVHYHSYGTIHLTYSNPQPAGPGKRVGQTSDHRQTSYESECHTDTSFYYCSAVTPFRCLAAMPPERCTRAGILPGCPNLDRGSREAEVEFESRTFRSLQPLYDKYAVCTADNDDDASIADEKCAMQLLGPVIPTPLHGAPARRVKWILAAALTKVVQQSAWNQHAVAPTRYRAGQLPSLLDLVITNERHFVDQVTGQLSRKFKNLTRCSFQKTAHSRIGRKLSKRIRCLLGKRSQPFCKKLTTGDTEYELASRKTRNRCKSEIRQRNIGKQATILDLARKNRNAMFKYMRHRRRNKPNAFSLRDRSGEPTNDPTVVSKVFTEEDIRQLLHKINPFCELGPDEVNPRIQETSFTLAKHLYLEFRQSLDEGHLPPAWKDVTVTPSYKTGDQLSLGSCRPTSLTKNGPEDITRADADKDLGIWLSSNMSSLHHEKSAQKAFAVLRMIRRTFSRITRMDFQILSGAYVRPLLEYAKQVLYSGRKKDVTFIERVQRAATKMVVGPKSVDYETRITVPDFFSLEYRRLRGDLILTWALFEQGFASRFSTVGPANTRGRHGWYTGSKIPPKLTGSGLVLSFSGFCLPERHDRKQCSQRWEESVTRRSRVRFLPFSYNFPVLSDAHSDTNKKRLRRFFGSACSGTTSKGKNWTRVLLLLELINGAHPVVVPGFEPRTSDMRGECYHYSSNARCRSPVQT